MAIKHVANELAHAAGLCCHAVGDDIIERPLFSKTKR
jgi:hypothetical protein